MGATTTRFFKVTSRIEIGSNRFGCAMYNSPMSAVDHDRYDDPYLRKILRDTRTIAMVGASANWNRPSYFAMKYLLDRGYRIIPVNPAAAGQEILGQKVYAS